MAKKVFLHTYEEMVSLDTLFSAWVAFRKGKRSRVDVLEFERNLMTNLVSLHSDLVSFAYDHGSYEAFTVSDPKRRSIHKATVRDRVLHRAIYGKLYPFFDSLFIADAFSCRLGKGTHKTLDRFAVFARKASQNHRRTVWVLKCDVRKFFASIDHDILLGSLQERIVDQRVMWLLERIVRSFPEGLPLGNLTSQLFSNVYMNSFDQYVKHYLRAKHYIRYADDFVLLSPDRRFLEMCLDSAHAFLASELRLHLHPEKIEIRTVSSGVDFLGWVHFCDHRVLRTTTKRRMVRNLSGMHSASIASYKGLLKHGNAYRLQHFLS